MAATTHVQDDLRGYLAQLEQRGLLAHIKREVDPRFELPAVLMQLMPQGKAACFEKVKGSAFPVAGNLVTTREALALALGCGRDDVPRTWRDRMRRLIPPEIVGSGPTREVFKIGDEARLTDLPVVTHAEKDAGAYITAGVVIATDLQTGARNCSFNRLQLRGPHEAAIRSMPPQQLGLMHQQAELQSRPLEVAIAIGLHPVELFAAATSPPDGVDELAIAGALRGEPVPLIRCETIDAYVPARAEIVLEGEILPGRREPEAPFGDFMQFYMPQVMSPIFRLKAITHRRDAVYHDIQAGTPDDMHILAPSREAQIYDALDRAGIEVRSVSLLPTILGIAVSIRKQADDDGAHAARLALTAYQWGKTCIVVDHDVDVYSYEDVLWAFSTRCRPATGITVLPEAEGFPRDEFHLHQSKVGIDATAPLGAWTEFERKQVPGATGPRLEDYVD